MFTHDTTPTFTTCVHSKWILCGEHAVLRGHPAIVFPWSNKCLKLLYHDDKKPLSLTQTFHQTPITTETNSRILTHIKKALELLDVNTSLLTGSFTLQHNIPIGAGAGFSAVLCVALSRFLVHKGCLSAEHMLRFSQQLENHLHGQSSGLDIAGVSHDIPLLYQINKPPQPLVLPWSPHFKLSQVDSLQKTSDCIQQVTQLWHTDPIYAQHIDNQMKNSVEKAYKALQSQHLKQLAEAIHQANSCFKQWGLISPAQQQQINQLIHAGALAAKPTGAGAGGLILSLWDHDN